MKFKCEFCIEQILETVIRIRIRIRIHIYNYN